MRTWWTTAYYELLKYSRMRALLIILIGLPLLLIFLLGSAFDQDIKPAKVALYIEDQGAMRAGIEQFWNSDDVKPYIEVLTASSGENVQDLVQAGSADYGVVVPSEYSERAVAGDTANWLIFSGRYEEKNIAADAVVNSYMVRANLMLAAAETLDPATVAGAELPNEGVRSRSLLAVKTLGDGDNAVFDSTSAMQYYAVAYLIMFLLYGGMSAAISLMSQKKGGTLHRIYAMPASFKAFVLGIITGSVALAAIQAIVIVTFTAVAFGVDWGSHFGLVTLICLFTTAAGAGLAIIIASFAGTEKTTQTLVTIAIFAMTFLSGGMVADIRGVVGDVAKWTINHWATDSLRAIMNGTDLSLVWHEIGVLAIIAVLLSTIAIIRLPKVVSYRA
ncbi:ABC transporter permease [Paenibacillus sp. sgz302251]|uniref:ABC transporter permease n=1 Tax=Paenibacillus sp. sgz302251 TaxID=3414493 RepID=UPI003C7BC235